MIRREEKKRNNLPLTKFAAFQGCPGAGHALDERGDWPQPAVHFRYRGDTADLYPLGRFSWAICWQVTTTLLLNDDTGI